MTWIVGYSVSYPDQGRATYCGLALAYARKRVGVSDRSRQNGGNPVAAAGHFAKNQGGSLGTGSIRRNSWIEQLNRPVERRNASAPGTR